MNYQNFVAKVYAELKLHRMTRKDLAKLTGYSENTINVFMSNTDSRDRSDNVAKAISAALHIELQRGEGEQCMASLLSTIVRTST